jgi:hypothetical protein
MNPAVQQALDDYLADLGASAPTNWIRQVAWQGQLVEADGSSAGVEKEVTVCVTATDAGLGQEYLFGGADGARAMMELQAALADEPESGWTMLRIEVDRDGERRVEFSHEAARALDDSSEDTFWDDVHQYLERNRPELEALAARLRESGMLAGTDEAAPSDPRTLPPSQRPNAADPPPNGDRRGFMGKLFGRP